MPIQRHRFDISTDTGGDWVDTGPLIAGLVTQLRLSGANFDTGCDFKLEGIQSGVVVGDYDNVGGQSWTRSPRILTFDTGGNEVGDQPPTLNEPLRLTVNQSEGVTGSKTGTLHVRVAG